MAPNVTHPRCARYAPTRGGPPSLPDSVSGRTEAADYSKRKLLQMTDESAIRFDERGLVPCVMQDWRTGEVLTLAYMDDEALRRTRESGEVHFFSRSRDRIWHKGETSGNVQRVRQIRYDCDGD